MGPRLRGDDVGEGDAARMTSDPIRLTVNGEEVSGGAECNPKTGYICLESEGSPIEFRNIKIKELP